MICEFDSQARCKNCKLETRFPDSVRQCCGVPGCTPDIAADPFDISAVGSNESGPGTELHSLLRRFGITGFGDCKCESRAAYMNEKGCDWCESNIEEIIGWLRESASERGLPFLDVAGRVLVRRAIANARRKEQARGKASKAEGGAAAG